MKYILFFLALLATLTTACRNSTSPENELPSIKAEKLNQIISASANPKIKIIDLRPSSLFQKCHIVGSISLPYDSKHFDNNYPKLDWDLDTQIILVDQYEHRGLDALEKISASGFNNVFYLENGFQGWEGKQLPCVSLNKD